MVAAPPPAPPSFAVTVTATQSTTWACGSLDAALVSTAPVRAVVRGTRIVFTPATFPMDATVDVSSTGCAAFPATNCSRQTAAIKPGGSLEMEGSRLRLGYDSNTHAFPEEHSCASGLLELWGDAGVSVRDLLAAKKPVVVRGAGTRDELGIHWDLSFVLRLTRLK